MYAGTLLTGLAPAVQRFAAAAAAADDLRKLRRLFWTAVLVYSVIGAAVFATVIIIAPALASLFAIPAKYATRSTTMFRTLGLCTWLVIIGACLNSFLAGLNRFVVTACINVLTSVVYVCLIALFLTAHNGITFLADAVTLGNGVGVLAALLALRDVIRSGRPRVVHRHEARELATFSSRLQVVPIAMLINNQSDRLVIGIVASAKTVGEFAIGSQVAVAARVAAGTMLGPMCTAFTRSHVSALPAELFARFRVVQSQWAVIILGSAAVLSASLPAVLHTWLGRPTGSAATFGILTIAAFAINLLSGPGTAYLRAIGLPSLEARYSFETILANALLTVALALTAGATGVVVGTLVAYAVMTGRFFWLFQARFAGATTGLLRACGRAVLVAIPVAGACGVVTKLIAAAAPGILGLLGCGIAMMVALAVYMEVTGLRGALTARPRFELA
jgi:O-antigen/teichoic acid export membrane protein